MRCGLCDNREPDERFRRRERLTLDRDFREVFARRRSAAGPTLVVYAMPNGRDYNRLGLVVSRQLGSAVERSRFKRLVRESFRLSKARQPTGWDWLVLPRLPKRVKGSKPAPKLPRPQVKRSAVEEELLKLMRRLALE
jgi:ribonuclease P protein component